MTDQPDMRAVALWVTTRHVPAPRRGWRRLLPRQRCRECGEQWPCRTHRAALNELAAAPLRIAAPWTRQGHPGE